MAAPPTAIPLPVPTPILNADVVYGAATACAGIVTITFSIFFMARFPPKFLAISTCLFVLGLLSLFVGLYCLIKRGFGVQSVRGAVASMCRKVYRWVCGV